jgi:type I restriction enzyme S subunit
MSKLQDLIRELCPEGVEFKKLGEVAELSRGKVYSKDYLSKHLGKYPVYSSQTANDGQLGCIDTYDFDGDYLTWTTDGAYAGTIFHRIGKFSITNVCGLINLKSDYILLRFLYYWLSITACKYVYQGMGNPKLMSNQMAEVEIPLPPLPIQEEIVRILDRFAEYAAELQAELQARKEQYEYYRSLSIPPPLAPGLTMWTRMT